jgi:hypothetical protein
MELVYVLCSLAAAELCEQHRAAVYEPNPLACLAGTQAELAQLARPGWRIAEWRCDATPRAPMQAVAVVASD